LALIRSRGRVNYGRCASRTAVVDESQQALRGGEVSIGRIVVAAAERPTVI